MTTVFGITDIITYTIGVIFVIVLPGPNSLYCLSVAAAHGKKSGIQAMSGTLLGDTLLIIATVLGAGTLLRLYPVVFDGIKLLGGGYLSYLGIRLLIGAYHTYRHRHKVAHQSPTFHATQQNYFYRALSLSLTNPKAILFFLSFFMPFADPSYPYPFLTFFMLALILQTVSFCYLLLLVFSGQTLAIKFSRIPWLMISSMALVGVLFMSFGVNLWLSQL